MSFGTVETNNGLVLEKGRNIQEIMENYLKRMGNGPDDYFYLTKKTAYYPVLEQQEMLEKITACLWSSTRISVDWQNGVQIVTIN